MMNRETFYASMHGTGTLDYEIYLRTAKLFECQTAFDGLCNEDELQFQIVHQTEELWMKLIAYTLLQIDELLQARNTLRVLTLFGRVHKIQRVLIESMTVLESMSPHDYQEIRRRLGNGSGQESPGYRTLLRMVEPLWSSFETHYLTAQGRTIEQIYSSEYRHCEAYMVAEQLAEYDELFQKFRFCHLQLIRRSIGIDTASLKGRPILALSARTDLFPQLWEIRSRMTEQWGKGYGVVRESIGKPRSEHTASISAAEV